MRHLKTSEAAALLNVSPNTLRAWERRFGFPKPQRSPGRHRLFTHGEVAALRDALQEGLSISSAVSRAREGLTSDPGALVGALVSFDAQRADRAIEAALALRSVERSVEEVLLPSLDEVLQRQGPDSAAWAFAARWAADWLRRAQRMAPAPVRDAAILIADASRDELDRDGLYIRAFELFCMRGGIRTLSLSARGVSGLGDALAAQRPDAVVIAGSYLDDDAVARWAYQVRLTAGSLPMAVYRRGGERARMRTSGTIHLPSEPSAAQVQLLELLERRASARAGERGRSRAQADAPARAQARQRGRGGQRNNDQAANSGRRRRKPEGKVAAAG
jgi:DNA-binding transcriptional MerR regulator